MVVEELVRCGLSVKSTVDDLFEQGCEAFVNPEAKIVTEVIALLNLFVCAFTVWYVKFVRVPLSESSLSLVILDLLSNNGSLTARIKLEENSVLTYVHFIRGILGC